MKGIELNKIAGAILLAGTIAMVASTVSHILFEGHSGAEEEKRGYVIEGAEVANEGGEPVEVKEVDILPLLASANPTAGADAAKKCAACHDFTKGGPNKLGPNLWNIVGSSHAHKDDYTYSSAMAEGKGKLKWDYQALSTFLHNPKKSVPGTKMGFAGISKPEERANVIAYLRSLSDSPMALPTVKASPAESVEKAAPAKK